MKKTRLGIFGLWRGSSFLPILQGMEEAEVAALCDRSPQRLAEAAAQCPQGVKQFSDFEEFIGCGLDGVLICNDFHQHAPYAIRAMELGVAVFSECTAGATMQDCVLLWEAAERTGGRYMLGENYPFRAPLLEMERLHQEGSLGRILYAEGEYNHTGTRETLKSLTPGPFHWRAWLPRTYYVTHSLGPLMHVTKQMPVQVSAFAVHSEVLEQYDDYRHNYDAFAMMNCITDQGALFRFTGCAAMGSLSGYRVCGEYGSAETGRSLGDRVNLTYHPWKVPEGRYVSQTYQPGWPKNGEEAERAGHGGGDFWMMHHFLRYIREGREPFFNLYRACAMSAVGILGWRSCLENGRTYAIPDFRDKAQRNQWRSDNLTPFPDENGKVTLPCAAGRRNRT